MRAAGLGVKKEIKVQSRDLLLGMTDQGCRTVFLLLCLTLGEALSSEPSTYSINTKKWSHVLDDHFISVTINPTDLLQGKAFGLGMNSTVAILKGLSPAYIRIGSADTGKYTFKRSRYPSDAARKEDEYIITESHWTVLNEVVRSAGLDLIVCLNAAHRTGSNRKWDTRNSLELISFSDSQGYNLTFQLGYELQRNSGITGHQYGKDLNRLRTILNAFPRYQNSKLIGPDIRHLNKKEDIEFINEALLEAGQILDAVTWHPRWPQPSKMKVSDISELGYEFPSDYLEWDRSQIGKILQRSVLKNPIWIGEPKTESTGTFAEGLLWARRLVLAAKLGVEVVMKQPSLMDISHPKPEYWIAYLHKRLLGKAVLETRAMNNQSEIAIVTHCTNSLFWAERPGRALDGAISIYAVNMGGKEQKVHLKGTWGGKSQIMLQYLLTSGSDPDSVFSQMTYLNGEPLMMTDDGNLPDIAARVRRIERGVLFKLPPYSVGFWVIPEARVKICQVQPAPLASANFENLGTTNMIKTNQKNLPNIRNLNQLLVDKLKNPVSESDEDLYDDRILSDDSGERDLFRESAEAPVPRTSRRVRQVTMEDIGQELKNKIREIRDMLESKGNQYGKSIYPPEALRAAEEKISALTDELGSATRMNDQKEEFGRFLNQAGLNQDFGTLMMNERAGDNPAFRRSIDKHQWLSRMPAAHVHNPLEAKIRRFRRSLSYPEDDYEEESIESYSFEEEDNTETRPNRKNNYRKGISRFHEDSDESSHSSDYSGSPPIKGLEEKYKGFGTYKVHDGKKKINDLRRIKKKNETEEVKKKSNVLGNDLQEEILMKEVEVLQKTEEAMANLIKNHKKRQQTIEEIILHEISDIKEDRLNALEDMRQHKEITKDVSTEYNKPVPEEIPQGMRGSVLDVLHSTKVKRSIPEGDLNLNGLENIPDEKKTKIIKRSLDSSYERSFRRRNSRKTHRDGDERDNRQFRRSRSERLERMKNFIQSRERIRDRNGYRKKHNRNYRKFRLNGSDEDSNEILGDFSTGILDRAEDMVIKEMQKEILKKPERKPSHDEMKQLGEQTEKQSHEKEKRIQKEEKKNDKSSSKSSTNKTINDNNIAPAQNDDYGNDNQKPVANTEEKKTETNEETETANRRTKTEEQVEYVPLKIDKNRGLNVLKRISSLVENINRDKLKSRKPQVDVEDLSEEFFGDSISKITKRRHRRSHHRDDDDDDDADDADSVSDVARSESSEETSVKDAKTLRKEIKLQKLLERRNRRKKLEDDADQSGKVSKARLRARLQGKRAKLSSTETPTTTTEEIAAVPEVTETPIEKLHTSDHYDKVEQPAHEEAQNAPTEKPSNEENVGTAVEEEPVNKTELTENTTTEKSQTTTTVAPTLKEEPPRETTPADVSDAMVVMPEVEGVYYNPVVLANPAEDILQDEPIGEFEPISTKIILINPYTGENVQVKNMEQLQETHGPIEPEYEFPVQDDESQSGPQNEDAYSDEFPRNGAELKTSLSLTDLLHQLEGTSGSKGEETGPPNVITELLEGELLDPWKGAKKDSRIVAEAANSQMSDELDVKEIYTDKELPDDASHDYAPTSRDPYGPSEFAPDVESDISHMEDTSSEFNDHIPDLTELKSIEDDLEMRETEDEEEEPKETKKTSRRVRRGLLDRRILTPEERIRAFKRMVHRRHTPFGYRNELPVSVEGDNFWKMAGSTVKAVFNDVIPDAYGKTKTKIENLGIAEYFKEFGKIVEQMKNLDRLFANIGQAAVRNYIKGTEDEKGDYIQVIERKSRNRRDVEGLQTTNIPEQNTEVTTISAAEHTTATPETTSVAAKTSLATTTKSKGLKNYAKERPNDLITDIFLMDSNPGIVEVTKPPTITEPPKRIPLHPFESRYAKISKVNYMNKFFPPKSTRDGRDLQEQEIQPPALQKFAPWMKTTKDFINEALTTLQRQRELSEMIARESVNDLVKREIERKVIGKREVSGEIKPFQVYQMPANRKREIQDPGDDMTSRFMNRLRPGVYIVPTEEMKNLRSEQIMKESSSTKPGMPNMVTLNIYYDKKKPNEWENPREELADPAKINPNQFRYYQTPEYPWHPVPSSHPPQSYVPPYPESTLDSNYIPPMQTLDPKMNGALNQRLLHYPEQYHEMITSAQRGYPISRGPHSYYYPDETRYGRTKSEWADLKPLQAPRPEMNPFGSNPIDMDSGWAVQFQPAKKKPTRSREPVRPISRPFPDKKRSIGDNKMDPNFSGLALPFWKFFTAKTEPAEPVKPQTDSNESTNTEELFAENRKRAEAKKKVKESVEKLETEEKEEDEGEEKSRRKRDVTLIELQDIVPDWIGTVQDLDNSLHEQHDELERLARLVPLPWSDYEDEDDPILSVRDLQLRRRRRSADATENGPQRPLLKKLDSEDSSLEVSTKVKDEKISSGNKTEVKTRATGSADDALTQFFKYAYESLIQMMKGMTDFI